MTATIEKEILREYERLQNKSKFCLALAPKVKKSHFTLRQNWFREDPFSTGLPEDEKTLKIIIKELKKHPKK